MDNQNLKNIHSLLSLPELQSSVLLSHSPRGEKLASLYSLQLICEESPRGYESPKSNEAQEIMSTSQSEKKFVKFKGFVNRNSRKNCERVENSKNNGEPRNEFNSNSTHGNKLAQDACENNLEKQSKMPEQEAQERQCEEGSESQDANTSLKIDQNKVFEGSEKMKFKNLRSVRSAGNLMKTENRNNIENRNIVFIPKRNFVKERNFVKVKPSQLETKKKGDNYLLNVSSPQIEIQSERFLNHKSSAPNLMTLGKLETQLSIPEMRINHVERKNENVYCQKCENLCLKNKIIQIDIQKVQSICSDLKIANENLKQICEMSSLILKKALKEFEEEAFKMIEKICLKNETANQSKKENIEKDEENKNYFSLEMRSETLKKSIEYQEELNLELNAFEDREKYSETEKFINELNEEIGSIIDKFLVEKYFESNEKSNELTEHEININKGCKLGKFGKIRKNKLPKIIEETEMISEDENKSRKIYTNKNEKTNFGENENMKNGFSFHYENSHYNNYESDCSVMSVENVNVTGEILESIKHNENFSTLKNQSTMNSPKIDILTESYDYGLEREIDEFLSNKNEANSSKDLRKDDSSANFSQKNNDLGKNLFDDNKEQSYCHSNVNEEKSNYMNLNEETSEKHKENNLKSTI